MMRNNPLSISYLKTLLQFLPWFPSLIHDLEYVSLITLSSHWFWSWSLRNTTMKHISFFANWSYLYLIRWLLWNINLRICVSKILSFPKMDQFLDVIDHAYYSLLSLIFVSTLTKAYFLSDSKYSKDPKNVWIYG